MDTVARRRLGGDITRILRIAVQPAGKVGQPVYDRKKGFSRQRQKTSFDLTDPFVASGRHRVEKRNTGEALAPNGQGFDGRAVFEHDHEGGHASLWKVDAVDDAPRLEHLVPTTTMSLLC